MPDMTQQATAAISRAIDEIVNRAGEARIAAGKRPVDAPITNRDDAAADLLTQMMIDIERSYGRVRGTVPRERAGFLTQQPEQVQTSPIQRLATAGGGEFTFEPGATDFVHTHPPDDIQFSETDMTESARHRKPSYISPYRPGSIVSGPVKRFNPATGETEEILAQLPTGRIAQYFLDKLRAAQRTQ